MPDEMQNFAESWKDVLEFLKNAWIWAKLHMPDIQVGIQLFWQLVEWLRKLLAPLPVPA